MSVRGGTGGEPTVSIALPVFNGAETVGPVIESALSQDHPDLELVISDNASTDDTESVCRAYARADARVVYLRHPRNVGLLNNFASAAAATRGRFVRWIGDADSLVPDYVTRTVAAFDDDPRRVLVTTQIAYVDGDGAVELSSEYDPSALSSPDPLVRFSGLLCLLTSGFVLLDPLYAMMRREVTAMPRRNILREDEVFAARLALAGPWGHVAAPLATRQRSEVSNRAVARLLAVPAWHQHVMDVRQSRELLYWIDRSALDPAQRRRARAEVLRLYARRKRNLARRGVAKLQHSAGRSWGSPATEAR